MSWIYELLKNRYERKWYSPWKTSDYIIWQMGALRPKNYGEILFSDEYNYLLYTLYWSKVSKRFIFRGFYHALINLTLFKIYATIPRLILIYLRISSEMKTGTPYSVVFPITIEKRVRQGTYIRDIITITRYLAWSSGPGTISRDWFGFRALLKMDRHLVNDLPTRRGLVAIPTIDTHSGLSTKELYLEIENLEPLEKVYEKIGGDITNTLVNKEVRTELPTEIRVGFSGKFKVERASITTQILRKETAVTTKAKNINNFKVNVNIEVK
ncbi:MAG: hypothetical protein B7O98_09475 [Zestosphaera tikiterensis]|uniref:Uncharacterized protein n=1 Tax=Zestosphaera tikiterensis TaxID=1973259 RepID=A0A2R7Y1V1_9CREN|nr:MAG: hypothetical protein B7O98_09475 [Zestosphaera tikiterensis]